MLPRVSKVECHDADYLIFSTSDIISNTLFRTGRWEEHLLQISKFFLQAREQPLLLDIGANLGAYLVPLAKYLQPLGGSVIAFEPQRIVYYQLCGNIVINRLDNVHAIHSAVGEAEGEIDIPEIDYENNRNVGAFSIDPRHRAFHGIETSMKTASSKVRVLPLDTLAVERAPALVKIDVEGHELAVLRGATQFLERHQFPPLLFEAWNFDWYKAEREALLAFVQQLGYQITLFGNADYIAQHPRNPVQVQFVPDAQGAIAMVRTR